MKVRWREHEIILVTILVITAVAGSLVEFYDLSTEQIETNYAASFRTHGKSFVFWKNILLPQLGAVFLLYVCLPRYKWICGAATKKSFSEELLYGPL